MTAFRDAILAQPDNLAAAARAFDEAVADIDLQPLRCGTLVFAAVGASQYATIPVVRALRAADAGRSC